MKVYCGLKVSAVSVLCPSSTFDICFNDFGIEYLRCVTVKLEDRQCSFGAENVKIHTLPFWFIICYSGYYNEFLVKLR